MHVAAALAAALAIRGGVSAQPVRNSTLSPSLSPTVAQTFAPTLTMELSLLEFSPRLGLGVASRRSFGLRPIKRWARTSQLFTGVACGRVTRALPKHSQLFYRMEPNRK